MRDNLAHATLTRDMPLPTASNRWTELCGPCYLDRLRCPNVLIKSYRLDCGPLALTDQREWKGHPNIFLLSISFGPGTTVSAAVTVNKSDQVP